MCDDELKQDMGVINNKIHNILIKWYRDIRYDDVIYYKNNIDHKMIEIHTMNPNRLLGCNRQNMELLVKNLNGESLDYMVLVLGSITKQPNFITISNSQFLY